MIHSGHQVISNSGKKINAKQAILLTMLVMCLLFVFTSCDGFTYPLKFTLEELATNLETIEIVRFLPQSDSDNWRYLPCETIYVIDDDANKDHIVQSLSNLEYCAVQGASSLQHAVYSFKLVYPTKCIFISSTDIHFTDKDFYCLGETWKDNYHKLYVEMPEIVSMLEKYVILDEPLYV